MNNKRNKGFTLIELLVVIAIIGVLSSIVISSVNNARAKGRDAKRKMDLVNLQTALEMYRTDNGSYPAVGSWSGYHTVSGCGIVGTLSGASGYIPNLAPTYIATLPADPSNSVGCWYGYLYYSDGTNYKLLDYVVPESFPAVGTKFYDPIRPTNGWKLCSGEPACSTW